MASSLVKSPLFPLPNVVLFPGAILPLHIFEERYKQMTTDALRNAGTVTMALLRPGWEMCYQQNPAIHPIVCIGTIASHQRLPDGRYNFLLKGEARARIVKECSPGPYRVATLEPLLEPTVPEIELIHHRQRMARLMDDPVILTSPVGCHFRKILNGQLPTARFADLVAFALFDDVQLKQSLLEEMDVVKRVSRIACVLDSLIPHLKHRLRAKRSDPTLN